MRHERRKRGRERRLRGGGQGLNLLIEAREAQQIDVS